MIGETFASVSPVYIALGTAVLLLGVQVWIRVRYALKVREAGGVHAPALAKDPFTGGDNINYFWCRSTVRRLTGECSTYLALDNWTSSCAKPNSHSIRRVV